jgi:hypothetical protein
MIGFVVQASRLPPLDLITFQNYKLNPCSQNAGETPAPQEPRVSHFGMNAHPHSFDAYLLRPLE